jgi:hypothetical protein
MEKDYLFRVKTIADLGGLPEGSSIYVKKEFKNTYTGLWSSPFGSFNVKVPKDICVKLKENSPININYNTREFKKLANLIARAESHRMY